MTKKSRKRKNLKRQNATGSGTPAATPSISEEALSTESFSDEENNDNSNAREEGQDQGKDCVNSEKSTLESEGNNMGRDVQNIWEQKNTKMSESIYDSKNDLNCTDGDESEVDTNSSVSALMLIVGPEKYTSNIAKIFEATINKNGIKIKLQTTPILMPDEASKWRNENLARILYVIDYSRGNRNSFREIDDTLSILGRNYLMSNDCMDFILAKESTNFHPQYAPESAIRAADVHGFVQKYNRPLITMVFEKEWEHDEELISILHDTFLNPFLHSGVTELEI